MNKRKLCDLLAVALPGAAAILNALPSAVKLKFSDPYDVIISYFSGYSMVPVGYACWGAMAAGVGSILLTVLGAVGLVKKSETLTKWMFGIAVVSLVMRLTTALMGNMTLIGGIISVLLGAETALIYYIKNYE